MKTKPSLSIRELTEIIRHCDSLEEMEQLISIIQTEFENYPISDQAFLLALIAVTLMNLTAESDNDSLCKVNLPQLLSQLSWNKMNAVVSPLQVKGKPVL